MHHFVEVLIFPSTHNWRLMGSKKTKQNNEPKRNLTLVCITFVGSPKYSGGSVVQFHCDTRGERQVEPLSRSHFHGERAPDQWECYTSVYVYKLTWAAEGHADKESESRLFKVISKSIRNKNISKDSSRAGARSLISGACSDTKMTPHKQWRDTLCLGSVISICWSPPQVSTGRNSLILKKVFKIMLLKTTWAKEWCNINCVLLQKGHW